MLFTSSLLSASWIKTRPAQKLLVRVKFTDNPYSYVCERLPLKYTQTRVCRNSYTGTRTVPDSYSCLCERSLTQGWLAGWVSSACFDMTIGRPIRPCSHIVESSSLRFHLLFVARSLCTESTRFTDWLVAISYSTFVSRLFCSWAVLYSPADAHIGRSYDIFGGIRSPVWATASTPLTGGSTMLPSSWKKLKESKSSKTEKFFWSCAELSF